MDSDQTILAGAARRCINPPPNIAHGGWGAQKHEQAEGIDMDLWVTALALGEGETRAILIEIDLQILTNGRADEIRSAVSLKTGVPVEQIRASVTHTHSGPVPYKSWIERGYDLVDPWFRNLANWAAEAAEEALALMQPAQMRAGWGECRINTNRRAVAADGQRFLGINPDGISDHRVGVVRLDAARGDPVATLVHFACHATVMGPANRLLTPDFPGAAKRVTEAALGGKCLFLQGCAGDQGPVQGFISDPNIYRQLGAILGHEAARVALSLSAVPSENVFREIIPSGAPLGKYEPRFLSMTVTPLRVLERDIAVPLREHLPEKNRAAAELEHWKSRLAEARSKADAAAATEATFMARRADIQLRMAEDFGGRTSVGIRAHFIILGDVALVGCNVEPFAAIGIAIQRASPFPFTLVSGYTNGRLAYLATPEEWELGGYEVDNSPFAQTAGRVFGNEVVETLRSLRV